MKTIHLSPETLLDALREARDALQLCADAGIFNAKLALQRAEITIEAAETDEEATPWFRNEYRCDRCAYDWEDEWDCMCNDRCPRCNVETEPHTSTPSPL
jgi:hypothetical protein